MALPHTVVRQNALEIDQDGAGFRMPQKLERDQAAAFDIDLKAFESLVDVDIQNGFVDVLMASVVDQDVYFANDCFNCIKGFSDRGSICYASNKWVYFSRSHLLKLGLQSEQSCLIEVNYDQVFRARLNKCPTYGRSNPTSRPCD
ncbi:uncharacterized protein Z519_00823 [Cladophialophora bantiana CBS 173.52]|uniref:Uncharacterized protein n=1 Tax=Cladophialophora bantiana (strain ATCC 10958 / CBS 173.52 / CDC B-1940 / NIH 8579) TaxID=1442370 RepID=A0A0D2I7B2_CLAB1|nr:uncharacterized protein Z519_00823 [Cladophialophora bantiana CBS 173.52]KIW99160.1 hypothetical protein Z519_00823 [Cladophialophora bantiana CBS 173.52]